MPKPRTIFADEIWAYRETPSKPLQRALIINTGHDYYSDIWSKLLDVPGQPMVKGKKLRYPCKWEDMEAYVARQKEIADREAAEASLDALREAELLDAQRAEFQGLHVTVPELVAVAMGRISSPRVAFSLESAADECGTSESFLRSYITSGELKVHYANKKMIILADDLREWIDNLPTERA